SAVTAEQSGKSRLAAGPTRRGRRARRAIWRRTSSGRWRRCSGRAGNGRPTPCPNGPDVTDAAVVGRLLDEYHEGWLAPSQVHVLAGSVHQARVSYFVTLPDGATHVIRAFRADELVPV